VEETPEAELRAQMETNFFGAVCVTRVVLPVMRRQQSGAIVMISSLGGQLSFAGFGAYSASKFALEGLTEALALEIAPLGLTAMIVEPGAFRTDFAGGALRHMPRLAAYEATVGPSRSFAQSMDGTQAGDPARAAEAVSRALASPRPPLRLQLGQDAVDSVRAHAQALLAEMEEWEPVARDVGFAPKAA
jgi:NAD(P)-dependent dehydrogenase (short-subunit alcohol dehydrogenase family)